MNGKTIVIQITQAMRILLVDDNQQYREILSDALRRYGHSVLTAGDGAEAFELLECAHFDLVIADIEMPVIRGTELCEMMRNDPRFQNIPFLFISGHASSRISLNSLKKAKEHVLSKMTPVFEIVEIAEDLARVAIQ